MRVVVTGSTGSLGSRLMARLSEAEWCDDATGIDIRMPQTALPGTRTVVADLTDPTDARWRQAIDGADAIVHFATTNPMPDCTWTEAGDSLTMTANLLDRGEQCGVGRFVFASSNHAMGGYKDVSPPLGPGMLTPDLPGNPGTLSHTPEGRVRYMAYASSKFFGERLVAAKAAASTTLTGVSLRIGWCQPGENHPSTMNAGGVPMRPDWTPPDDPHDLAWFRGMWLSTPDFGRLMERAILADANGWGARSVIVNGMSANTGSLWDLTAGERLIGYRPEDDWTRVLRG